VTRPYEVASLDDLERIEGDPVILPVRLPLGIRAFGVNAYAPGKQGQVVEEHDELGSGAGRHEELYCVVRGHATFEVDGEKIDAPEGTLLFVRDPAVRRSATSDSAETIVLVVGGVPGKAFEPSPWESWLEALPRFIAGDYAEATAMMTRALEEHPDNANVLYNLACCESLGGVHDRALEHLVRAVEQDARMREWAQDDSDFDPIRDDPRFPARPAGEG
jgi:tetratricopeptide (TPR) repeat protein